MQIPPAVQVTEVGPRDGLQNEPVQVPTGRKLELIGLLAAAGIGTIEATSFVHPRWIPALADAEAVVAALPARDATAYRVLIPNVKGYERARPFKPDAIALVCSASESHNQRNLNRSTAESLAGLQETAALAKRDGVRVQGVISTSFWCPFEGRIAESRVCWVAEQYAAMGVDDLSLADTLGSADPLHVATLVRAVRDTVDTSLTLHLHDTYGLALACVLAGLDAGVTIFDSSVGGLGGCPYAPGAAGNLATEDLVFLLHRLGVTTGIDEAALLAAARLARDIAGHPLPSKRLALAGVLGDGATGCPAPA